MKTKPKTNKKSMEFLWFDQDKGFIFSDDSGSEIVAGFQCTFSYNVFYGEIGYIVLNTQKHFEPKNETEIIVFLKFNKETNEITGKYASLRSSHNNENVQYLFNKIEDRFNESISDLNSGYSIEF
jgi:hypothetical protein